MSITETTVPSGGAIAEALEELELVHGAFVAGVDYGIALEQRRQAEDRASDARHALVRRSVELLLDDATFWTNLAVETASTKGPAWAEAIRQQAQAQAVEG